MLAGCGGAEPAGIPQETAEALAARSELVAEALADGDPCRADRLADELVEASAEAGVPEPYRRRLLASARSLADRIECPPPPPPAPAAEERDDDEGDDDDDDDDDDDHDDDEGKGKGEKKGRGRG